MQDAVERCYFTFRRRLRDIGQASSCDCNSCTLVPKLDLKIVVHHGPIVRQRIAGREELVGSSVVVVHRLLKNHVTDDGGPRAYAMYTDACVAAMGLDPAAAGLERHAESFEGVGEIVGWVRDLEAAWQDELDRARVVVAPADASRTYTANLRRGAGRRVGLRHLAGPPSAMAARRDRRRGAAGVGRAPRRRDRQPLHPRSGRGRGGGPRLAAVRLRDVPLAARRSRARRRSSTRSRSSRTTPAAPASSCGSAGRARPSTGRSSSRFCRASTNPSSTGWRRCERRSMRGAASRDAAGGIAAPEPPVPESAGRYLSEPISGTA